MEHPSSYSSPVSSSSPSSSRRVSSSSGRTFELPSDSEQGAERRRSMGGGRPVPVLPLDDIVGGEPRRRSQREEIDNATLALLEQVSSRSGQYMPVGPSSSAAHVYSSYSAADAESRRGATILSPRNPRNDHVINRIRRASRDMWEQNVLGERGLELVPEGANGEEGEDGDEAAAQRADGRKTLTDEQSYNRHGSATNNAAAMPGVSPISAGDR